METAYEYLEKSICTEKKVLGNQLKVVSLERDTVDPRSFWANLVSDHGVEVILSTNVMTEEYYPVTIYDDVQVTLKARGTRIQQILECDDSLLLYYLKQESNIVLGLAIN